LYAALPARFCVLDGDTLYVGEEDGGIGQLERNDRGATARRVVPVDNQRLDVEGLATIDRNGGRYLLAPSPTDNAYAVFRLPEAEYVGRFAAAAGSFDASSVTDGILAAAGDFSPAYPDGILPAVGEPPPSRAVAREAAPQNSCKAAC